MKYNINAPSYPLAFVITVSSNGLWSVAAFTNMD